MLCFRNFDYFQAKFIHIINRSYYVTSIVIIKHFYPSYSLLLIDSLGIELLFTIASTTHQTVH